MIRRLIILLLIVGCVFADVKFQNSDEIGEFKQKSFPINSDNKWSINIGLLSTKGTILGLARNYRIREKTSVFILGGLLSTGLGVIYEQNYNDNGYVIGAYSGIDLGVGYYSGGWFYSASWRIAPFIAYQRVFKNQHCFSIGVSSGLLKSIYNMKRIYSNFEPNHQYPSEPPPPIIENNIRAFIFPILSYEYRF